LRECQIQEITERNGTFGDESECVCFAGVFTVVLLENLRKKRLPFAVRWRRGQRPQRFQLKRHRPSSSSAFESILHRSWYQVVRAMSRRTSAALLLAIFCHVLTVCSGIGRVDSSLLFKASAAAYGTSFGPYVRVATSGSAQESRLLPDSVTVQAWIMPLPRDGGQKFLGTSDLGQVVGNMARTFSPNRIFAGYSLHCSDSSSLASMSCSFFVATSTTSYLEPSCIAPMNNWSHLSGVYDASTGVADLYLDGSICASSTKLGGSTVISYFLRSSFTVGAWLEDAPGASPPILPLECARR